MPSVPAPVPVIEQAAYEGGPHAPVAYVSAHPVIPPAKSPNAFMRYWRKMGAGSLLVSIGVHAALIALAIAIVTVTVKEPKVDFLPGGGSKGAADASQQLAHQVQTKKRSAMNKTTPMRKVVSNSQTATISLPDIPMEAVDVPEMSSLMGGAMGSGGFGPAGAGGGFGKGTGIGGQAGFVSLPPSMKSRCSAAERLQKLKESGVGPECETAVSTALEYFKTKQNPDGSWGTANKSAMTGFALLCYLGRCETPDSPFYGDNVMGGILYLIELSNKNDGFIAENPKAHGATYEHGIATYALGEMYSLARLGGKSLPGMREAFEKGVKIIIDKQLPVGGWGYTAEGDYRTTGGGDPSVTGWQYQALKAAKLSGLKINGLHPAIDKTVKYLEGIQTKDGGFGGTNREAGAYTQWTMTGVGVLGLQTLATGKSAKVKKGIEWAYAFHQKEPPTWKDANLYAWYYYAQIYFQNGGPEQKFWNDTVLPEVLKNQDKTGCWKKGNTGGNYIYDTALCTLMLEVYYRYLKVGDRDKGSIFDR